MSNGSSECRKCGKTIYWHKSSKTGKNYPTDSADDHRAFHKCIDSAQPKPTPNPPPLKPDYFSATVEERVTALEKQVAQLTRTVQEVQRRQPISDEDIPL
ncbi:MAG TPA: hypothetical protein VKB49_24070 [Candidatus Sulfotelmatobacter sp.]|nr:hypothetical protein [Candidatus Sulfotelmatobacter sp.]